MELNRFHFKILLVSSNKDHIFLKLYNQEIYFYRHSEPIYLRIVNRNSTNKSFPIVSIQSKDDNVASSSELKIKAEADVTGN